MTILQPRARVVGTVKERVEDILGEGKGVMAVFPLSPSSLIWDYQSGCTLKRYLKKAHGWGVKMPSRVFLGQVVDRALMKWIDGKVEPDAVGGYLWDLFFAMRDIYKHADEDGFVEQAKGLTLAAINHYSKVPVNIVETQKKIKLYIGSLGGHPEAKQNLVVGFLDWIEKEAGGYWVKDLKVGSYRSGSLGKYKLQVHTYNSALWQAGYDIRGGGLERLYVPEARIYQAKEEFTLKDYDETIRQYREARDHYKAVESGRSDFRTPMLGSEKCRAPAKNGMGGCDFYEGCPMAGNSGDARKHYKEIGERAEEIWKLEV